MKVSKLIELLSDLDPDAEVYVMSQRSHPFEDALDGVTIREDFVDRDDDDEEAYDDAEAPSPDGGWSAPESKLPRNDVFLLVRRQAASIRQERSLGRAALGRNPRRTSARNPHTQPIPYEQGGPNDDAERRSRYPAPPRPADPLR